MSNNKWTKWGVVLAALVIVSGAQAQWNDDADKAQQTSGSRQVQGSSIDASRAKANPSPSSGTTVSGTGANYVDDWGLNTGSKWTDWGYNTGSGSGTSGKAKTSGSTAVDYCYDCYTYVHYLDAEFVWTPADTQAESDSALEEKAAQGSIRAQYALGMRLIVRYLTNFPDNSGSADGGKALVWLEKVATRDYAKAADGDKKFITAAARELGKIFADGKPAPSNATLSVKWFQQAAAQGDTQSQTALGKIYANGEQVKKNTAEAQRLWKLASKQKSGDAAAAFNLGLMFAHGDGVERSMTEALTWWQRAVSASATHADVHDAFAELYADGELVPKNLVEALAWSYVTKTNRAFSIKNNERIARLEKELGADHTVSAQQRAVELFKKINGGPGAD